MTRTRLRIAVAALIAATAALPALAAYQIWRPAPSAAPSPSASARTSPGLYGTDAAWLSLMISMNDSTLVLLDRAAPQVTDSGLADFVTTLAASHRSELADMRAHAERADLVVSDDHAGHEIPGVVTPADLARIEAQTGTAFDTAVRECLREHLEQGARLAVAEQTNGTDDETRQLAQRVGQSWRADLARLDG